MQAGLLQNPALGVSIRLPDRLYSTTDVGLDLTQNLLNLILLTAKREVAQAQLAAAQFRIAASVLDLVADVKKAYFRLVADQAVAGLLRDRVAASDASASLGRRLHDAGNISDLDLSRQQADAELTRTGYADAPAAGLAHREELNRLMGLFGLDTAWTVPDTLPTLPSDRLPYERLEAMAITGNLRLAALRRQTEASARALGVAREYGWLTDVQLGVSTQNNPEGYRATGPRFPDPAAAVQPGAGIPPSGGHGLAAGRRPDGANCHRHVRAGAGARGRQTGAAQRDDPPRPAFECSCPVSRKTWL